MAQSAYGRNSRYFGSATRRGSTRTRQFVEFSGRLEDGILEQHATWEALWDRSNPAVPRLKSLTLIDFEQVHSQTRTGTIFADITRSVLAHNPSYAQQLMRGMNHWLARIPNSRSLANFGNPGLAIGDVNGDGLADLYVCQEQGTAEPAFLTERGWLCRRGLQRVGRGLAAKLS